MIKAQQLRGIYVIVGDGSHNVIRVAQAALNAGVTIVQYRRKAGVIDSELQAIRTMTREYSALLILNDDWRLAQTSGCDGVHLGPGDHGYDHPRDLRREWAHGIIGLSCGTIAEAQSVDSAVVNYLGVGPVFATNSKGDAGEPIGLEGLRAVAAITPLPVCAIGGISDSNLSAVRMSGVAMAAVISGLAQAENLDTAARSLVRQWEMKAP